MQPMAANRPAIELPDNFASEQPAEQSPEQLAMNYASLPVESMVDMEICEMVVNRKRSSEDARRMKKIVWDKCWDHYRNVYDVSGKEAWQATTFQPETAKVIEAITSNLHTTALGPEMPIEWQCKVKEYEQNVLDTNDILRNDFVKGRAKVKYTDLIRSLCVVGTSIGKVGYCKESETVMVKQRGKISVMDRFMEAIGRPVPKPMDTYVPQDMLVKDWAEIEYRDLYKFFPQPGSTDIDKDHWYIEESEISNAQLSKLAQDPDDTQRIRPIPYDIFTSSQKNPDDYNADLASRRMALMQSSTTQFYFDPDMPHQLLEMWGPVPCWMLKPEERNDESKRYKQYNAWIWVIDGRWVARAQLCPYRDAAPPYFKSTYIQIPGDFYGVGPAELMLGLQIDLNETVNTGSDQVNLSLNKIVAILKDKVPTDCWNRLVSKPGAQWLFENVQRVQDAMQIIEFPPITRDWYMKIQMIRDAIAEVTAANKVTLGVGGGSDEAGGGTFRGQLLNKHSSNERFMLYSRVYETTGLADAFRKMYHRVYQFKDYESVENVIGKDRAATFEFLPPEKLEQVANLVPLGVLAAETKGVKLAQKAQMVQLFAQYPWFKTYELCRSMWIDMGNADADTVTFSKEEMNQFNEFRRQVMAETAQGPMGGQAAPGGQSGGPGGASAPATPGGMPVAGNTMGPSEGMPLEAMPARGPGASSIDVEGMPMS
jgi:hypothetical protein